MVEVYGSFGTRERTTFYDNFAVRVAVKRSAGGYELASYDIVVVYARFSAYVNALKVGLSADRLSVTFVKVYVHRVSGISLTPYAEIVEFICGYRYVARKITARNNLSSGRTAVGERVDFQVALAVRDVRTVSVNGKIVFDVTVSHRSYVRPGATNDRYRSAVGHIGSRDSRGKRRDVSVAFTRLPVDRRGFCPSRFVQKFERIIIRVERGESAA